MWFKKKLFPRIIKPRFPKPKTKLHEKFSEGSDPIRDLKIGLSPGQHAIRFANEFGGGVEKISETYFGDKKHIGYAYVLYYFFHNIVRMGYSSLQREFELACENENYYGNRPDIVEDRKQIAQVLNKHFNIIVDYDYAK